MLTPIPLIITAAVITLTTVLIIIKHCIYVAVTMWLMQIAAAVDRAGAQTDQQIKALLQQKADEIMSKIDLSKALSLDGSPEEAVKHAMGEASAQLQAEGANFHLAQAEPQAPPSSKMQLKSLISTCLD